MYEKDGWVEVQDKGKRSYNSVTLQFLSINSMKFVIMTELQKIK